MEANPPKKRKAQSEQSKRDETARAIGHLRLCVREIADAGVDAAVPYRKRLRLLAIVANEIARECYEADDA